MIAESCSSHRTDYNAFCAECVRLRLAAAELHLFSGHGCDCRHMAEQRAAYLGTEKAYLSEQSAESGQVLTKEGTKAYSSGPTRQAWKNDGHAWECGYNPFSKVACTCDRPGLKAVGKDWPTDLNSEKQEGE